MQNIIQDILAELKKAETKHPKWPADPMYMDQIINEEKGEVTQAVVNHVMHHGSKIEIVKELKHTIVTSLRMLKVIGEYPVQGKSDNLDTDPFIRRDLKNLFPISMKESEKDEYAESIIEIFKQFANQNYISIS